ncbi:MAG: ABC transporter ATP-binding protein [Alicyclobacillaceae bacterium]|nr:ABC transporter ATP-binding protein [Alicyclobacillaceae bacterium]
MFQRPVEKAIPGEDRQPEPGIRMPRISVEGVSKIYRSKKWEFTALDRIDLTVEEGEFVSLLGPSGSGKSTLLRLIAGLEPPTEGRIRVDGRTVKGPGADRGMVFQRYTLFPWLTVEQNIAFGLRLRGESRAKRREVVEHYLRKIGLEAFRSAYPKALSGGMQQRVAIARALANRPSVLLMDEPFGALDPITKGQMQEMLVQLWEQEGTTVIFVTHDVEEAIFLSQRIVIMAANPGRIIAEVRVPFGRSRGYDLRDTEAFLHLKRQIVRRLEPVMAEK